MIIIKLGEVKPKDYKNVNVLIDNKIVKPTSISKLSENEYYLEYWSEINNKMSGKMLSSTDFVHIHK